MTEFTSEVEFLTHGRSSFVPNEPHYEQAPASLQAELIATFETPS